MLGLETLYNSDEDFKLAAIDFAVDFLDTASMTFAEEWLLHDHVTQNDGILQSNVSENSTDDTQNVTDDRETDETLNNSDEDVTDSREKLEADASELTADYAASGDVCDALYGGIVGLLDRQAAITENEIGDVLLNQDERIAELQAQVDNLAHDLRESERLREEMREELSIAYDHAHDLLSRRDRGLE